MTFVMVCVLLFFFFNDTATTEIYTLSLHDALPIRRAGRSRGRPAGPAAGPGCRRPRFWRSRPCARRAGTTGRPARPRRPRPDGPPAAAAGRRGTRWARRSASQVRALAGSDERGQYDMRGPDLHGRLEHLASGLVPVNVRAQGASRTPSVIVSDQGPLDRCADLPVVPDGGVEGEQPLDDAGPQPGGAAAAVAFQPELVLQRPDDRLHPLAQPVGEGPGGLLVLAGRAEQGQAQVGAGEERLGVLAGQALVGDDGGAGGGAVGGLIFE